jgi:Asp-tRNA(Asn)/Glu-tRNA(Gln) amidotransferase B subunit
MVYWAMLSKDEVILALITGMLPDLPNRKLNGEEMFQLLSDTLKPGRAVEAAGSEAEQDEQSLQLWYHQALATNHKMVTSQKEGFVIRMQK